MFSKKAHIFPYHTNKFKEFFFVIFESWQCVKFFLLYILTKDFIVFFQGIGLSIWTVGFKKTFTELVPRFPGLFLFPIFGLFTFGPKSTKGCQCLSYGNNKMEISFTHTYVNLILWVLESVGVSLYLEGPITGILIITLPVSIVLFFLILLFQLLEKTCCISCCSPCCLPFTERSVFVEDSDEKDREQQQQQQSEGDFEMMQVA